MERVILVVLAAILVHVKEVIREIIVVSTRSSTVYSYPFMGYTFSWILWVQSNHEFKCSTIYRFVIVLYANHGKTTD